jgi:hypothetical protein
MVEYLINMLPHTTGGWSAFALITLLFFFDALAVCTMAVERFGGSVRGRLVRFIGRLLPPVFGSFKRSLNVLADWHDIERRKVKLKAMGEDTETGDRHPFSYWMVDEIVRKYENNAQGFAYLGAALLIFVIGLRGVKIIGNEEKEWIILALLIEFTLIGVVGLLLFYKPEDDKSKGGGYAAQLKLDELTKKLAEKEHALETFKGEVESTISKIRTDVDALQRAGEESTKESYRKKDHHA